MTMKKILVIICVGLSTAAFSQVTMKEKLKPLIEAYLKTEPLYKNTVISEVVITNISIIDEKEKIKSLFDFYHAYRLKQIEQIGFIKGKADFIEQHTAENKELFRKYVGEINTTLQETVPLIDSLWLIEDKWKTATPGTSTAEYYLVTFNFIYTLDKSRVVEKNHRVIFTSQMDIIHHDHLNR
jgi:hypothetical protein